MTTLALRDFKGEIMGEPRPCPKCKKETHHHILSKDGRYLCLDCFESDDDKLYKPDRKIILRSNERS